MDPRRQFRLPEHDEAALRRYGLEWETIVEDKSQWLILHDRPIVPGYTVSKAATALLIPPTYPDTQIDMAYFSPDLTRADRRPIKALTPRKLDGRMWQQWSRHRTKENPWRPGEDDIDSHLMLVDHWLQREVKP